LSGGGTWAGSDSQYNVAIGNNTLSGAMDGAAYNVALGHDAGKSITTGSGNIVIGYDCGDELTTGQSNTFVGYGAGHAAVGGNGNTLIGYLAGANITSGAENTIIGHDCDVASNDNTNNVVIGHDLTATDKNNAVFIGNNTNHIENDFNADATWNYSSDVRQKKDIEDDTLGLEFINDLRPVTYKHKSPSEFPKEWKAYDADDKRAMGGDKTIHGLIAQEVKQALDNQGVDTFGGWSVGDDGRQRISAEKMVMPLIKAVQELSAEVKSLKQQLEDK